MKSSVGRWVTGENFFGRETDLKILRQLIQDRNHVLLTGQRRMGKTSIMQELGRQLQGEGWTFLFCDVEGAESPEDVIAEMTYSASIVQSRIKRFARGMGRWLGQKIEELDVHDFRVKIRAGIDTGNWKRHGKNLLQDCAKNEKPVLLVIDELPIFLKRMLDHDQDTKRVDEFLSWLRGEFQQLGQDGPVLIVSGSIGLEPLVVRLGIPDRINYLYSHRLGPWDRDTSIECFEQLANSSRVSIENGVAEAVYDALGIGIPHHIQSFFRRLKEFAIRHQLYHVTEEHVNVVYHTELLGPAGWIDLGHYRTRLKDALTEDSYTIAETILAEAAIQNVFTSEARTIIEVEYGRIVMNAQERIAEVLDILTHDGYLTHKDDGYRFSFRLLKDWWAIGFRDNYIPLTKRQEWDKFKEIE